jgi:orotate phosphoribosyltransferase
MASEVILQALEKVKHILGPITRKDGMIVPLFIDTVPLMFQPDTFKLLVCELGNKVRQMDVDVVAGCVTVGVPLAAGVALEVGKRFAIVRKEPKGYSQKRAVDGNVGKGDRVVLLDDFYVSGENKELFMDHIAQTGGKVTNILSVGLLSEKLLRDWQVKFTEVKVNYLVNYVEMSRRLMEKGIISKELNQIVEYFFTDPYHWQENKQVWDEFNSLLTTEPLAKK